MDAYHWTVVPFEQAERFTGGRLLGEVQVSSLALEFSFEYLVWDNCLGVQ